MLPNKPYGYALTPTSYYERSTLTLAAFVAAMRADIKALDSRDESLLADVRRIPDGVVLTRVTRWIVDGAKGERRDYLVVDGATEFVELAPPPGYAAKEPSRFTVKAVATAGASDV